MDGLLSAIRGHRRMLEWAVSVGDEKLAASQRHSLAYLLGLSVERVVILDQIEGKSDGQADGLRGLPIPAD